MPSLHSAQRCLEISSTRPARLASRKCQNQGAARSTCDHLMLSGDIGSVSMAGTCFQFPGEPVG